MHADVAPGEVTISFPSKASQTAAAAAMPTVRVVSISPRRIPSHSLTVLRVALSEF
jgi:hypothetical protein